jgi:hypothetical protein
MTYFYYNIHYYNIHLYYIKGKYIYYAEGGGGDEDVEGGGTEIFSGIKGGALKVIDTLTGGGL